LWYRRNFSFISTKLKIKFIHVSVQYAVLQVKNNGGYAAEFTITYTLSGLQQTITQSSFPVGTTRSKNVPAGAINIQITAKAILGEQIFSHSIPTPQWKCYVVGGTTLNTNWNYVTC
jgi:hypothetical protein